MKEKVMASQQVHPEWCVPDYCTAFTERYRPYHRSTPYVIPLRDPQERYYVSLVAFADGSDITIEIGIADSEDEEPWWDPDGNRSVLGLLTTEALTLVPIIKSLLRLADMAGARASEPVCGSEVSLSEPILEIGGSGGLSDLVAGVNQASSGHLTKAMRV